MTDTVRRATPKRADAVRNVERIIDAAIACLSERPNATMAEIAKQAGLGRVTLYGHFPSRSQLLDAVLERIIAQGERTLETVELDGDARKALTRLIESSWHLVDQSRAILTAAEGELSPTRIRELHDGPAARVEALILRGRDEGVFRTDMPASWQVAVLHQVLHGAASEISSGRLDPREAPQLIVRTALALLEAQSAPQEES